MTVDTKAQTEQALIAAITPVFREVMEDETLIITRELDANQVEAWDSLNHITLIVSLESAFDIQFTTDELAAMVNIGDLIDCLKAKGCTGNVE